MPDGAVRIFLADDHAMVRDGLAALIACVPDIEVVGHCGDGLKVVGMVTKIHPDVVVLDIAMPGLNGLDICRELHRKTPGVAVLILTMYDDAQFVVRAMKHGASGYLLKESAGDRLIEAIRSVSKGDVYIGPGISQDVSLGAAQPEADPYEALTTREREVLQMIAEGKTNRKIAARMGLAVKTVDSHRTRLMSKLNIHDQTRLVKYALKRGIVRLP